MRDANTDRAKSIALEIAEGNPCLECMSTEQFRGIIYASCLQMAEAKDAALKQFLIEHISTDAVVETNENGEPLAKSFIAAGEARIKAAEQVYNRYKQFEERML